MIRELKEETGYIASPDHLESIGDFTFGEPSNPYNFIFYRVITKQLPSIKLEKESHEAYQWVTAQECYDEPNLISDLHDLLKRTGLVS